MGKKSLNRIFTANRTYQLPKLKNFTNRFRFVNESFRNDSLLRNSGGCWNYSCRNRRRKSRNFRRYLASIYWTVNASHRTFPSPCLPRADVRELLTAHQSTLKNGAYPFGALRADKHRSRSPWNTPALLLLFLSMEDSHAETSHANRCASVGAIPSPTKQASVARKNR